MKFIKHIENSRVINLELVKQFFKSIEGNLIIFEYVGDTYSKWEFRDKVGRDIMYNAILDKALEKK